MVLVEKKEHNNNNNNNNNKSFSTLQCYVQLHLSSMKLFSLLTVPYIPHVNDSHYIYPGSFQDA